MALIIRMDIDRPYGKSNLIKHIFSKLGSEYYFPRIPSLGYLDDLHQILFLLNKRNIRAYIFFRQCTLPCKETLKLIELGNHIAGLHLENSRSFGTFQTELGSLQSYLGGEIVAFSKHGSGKKKYGWHHYAPYEPEKYMAWAEKSSVKIFFGNLENPSINKFITSKNLLVFPSAYWLDPHWRDLNKFNSEWLINEAHKRDVVLLIHPDNITCDSKLYEEFIMILSKTRSKLIT